MERLTTPGVFLDAVPEGARKRFPNVAPIISTIEAGAFDMEINDIVLQDQLARGAYGVVYKGQVKGKTYAIKVLDLVDCVEEQVNILVEIALLKSFPSNTLVSYHGCAHIADARSSENKVMIAMELCERGALRECLQLYSRESNWELIVRLGMDIAQGLHFLHERGIVHRDVKTTNILVSRDWRAKLCDFSFACHGDTASKHEYIYGTDEFMAPEIALGEDFNIAADMFSYGIVLCEMICGKEPSGSFLKRSPRDLFALNEAELRQSVMPGCPESLEALTLQCCSREPDSRTSAEECVMWLEDLYASMGGDAQLRLPDPSSLLQDSAPPVFSPVREGTVVYPKSMDRRDDGNNGYSPAGQTSLASKSSSTHGNNAINATSGAASTLSSTDPSAMASRIYYLELQVQELKAENKSLNRGLSSLLLLTEDARRGGLAGRGTGTGSGAAVTTSTLHISGAGGGSIGGMSLMQEFGKSPVVLTHGLSPRGGVLSAKRAPTAATGVKVSPLALSPANAAAGTKESGTGVSSSVTTTAAPTDQDSSGQAGGASRSPFPPKAKPIEPAPIRPPAAAPSTAMLPRSRDEAEESQSVALSHSQLEQVRGMIDRALEEERALQEAVYRVKREEDWEMYSSMLEERLIAERQRFDDIIDENMKRFEEYLMARGEAGGADTSPTEGSTQSSASDDARGPEVSSPRRREKATEAAHMPSEHPYPEDTSPSAAVVDEADGLRSSSSNSSNNANVTIAPLVETNRTAESQESRASGRDEGHSDQTAVILRLERRLESVMVALDKLSSEKDAAARRNVDQNAVLPAAKSSLAERGDVRGGLSHAGSSEKSHRVSFIQDHDGSAPAEGRGTASPIERSRFESIDEIAWDQIRSVAPPIKVQHGPRFGSPRILSSEDSNDNNTKHFLKYDHPHDEHSGIEATHSSHEAGHTSYPMDHGRSSGSPGAAASTAANSNNNNYNSNSTGAAGTGRASDDLTAALKLFVDALSRNQSSGGAAVNGHSNSSTETGNGALTGAASRIDSESLHQLTHSLRLALGNNAGASARFGGDSERMGPFATYPPSSGLPGHMHPNQPYQQHMHHPEVQPMQLPPPQGAFHSMGPGNTMYSYDDMSRSSASTVGGSSVSGYPYAAQLLSPRMPFNPQSVLSTPMSATTTWRTVGSEGSTSVRGSHRHSSSSSSRQSPDRLTSRSGGSGGSGGNTKRLFSSTKEELKQIGTRGTPRGENADSTIARNFHRFDASGRPRGSSGGGGNQATTPVSLRSVLEDSTAR